MGRYKYDSKRYVEDSTKGTSMLNPVSYKGDALIQAWLDSREVAMISVWLDKGGWGTRYLSDVVKGLFTQVVNTLIEQKQVEVIETTGEARELLEMKYRATLNPGGRGKKNLMHNLVLDSRKVASVIDREYIADSGRLREYVERKDRVESITDAAAVHGDSLISDATWERVEEERKKDREALIEETLRKHREEVEYDKDGVVVFRHKRPYDTAGLEYDEDGNVRAVVEAVAVATPAPVAAPVATVAVKDSSAHREKVAKAALSSDKFEAPRKMTNEELDRKGREIAERDRAASLALDRACGIETV